MRGCGAVDGDRGLGPASSAGHRRGSGAGREDLGLGHDCFGEGFGGVGFEVVAARDLDQLGVSEEGDVLVGDGGWDDGVVGASDDFGGGVYVGQEVGEGLAVEEGFPGGSGGHLSVGVPGDELLGGDFLSVEGGEVGGVGEAGLDVVGVGLEELIADFAFFRLQADGVDEHEFTEARLVGGGHLGGDVAAEAKTDQGDVGDAEFVEQERADGGDVADAAHPVAALGAVPAGQRWEDDIALCGEGVVELEPAGIAGLMVDDEDGWAFAAAEDLDGEAGDLDGGLGVAVGHGLGLPIAFKRNWVVVRHGKAGSLVVSLQ